MTRPGDFMFTDGWHPTVNPSARMAVHHFRFVEMLGTSTGILNETPRWRGGSTLRLMRINLGRVHIIPLPGTLEWVPWWLPASNTWARNLVESIYQHALNHDETNSTERSLLRRVVDSFRMECESTTGLTTVGEALFRTMQDLHRELVPSLPHLDLISLTHHPARLTLADALEHVPGGLLQTLARWAEQEQRTGWRMLGVATSINGDPMRIRMAMPEACLVMEPLACGTRSTKSNSRPSPLSDDDLVLLLRSGNFVPSSRLVSLAEVTLHLQGWKVRHFGNTYGRVSSAGALLGVSHATAIPCCDDDADSWHWADIQRKEPENAYPLHLLEICTCGPEARSMVTKLIVESLHRRVPVHLIPQESLDETILGGGT